VGCTGSRLLFPNMVSTSPIQVVMPRTFWCREIGRDDVILQLPDFNNPCGLYNRTSALTTRLDWPRQTARLGPQRTLVPSMVGASGSAMPIRRTQSASD